MITVKELIASLREGPFTSLGSYPKFYITADCEVLSHKAVMQNLYQIGRAMIRGNDTQWQIVAADINYEDPDLYCAETGKRIESAYAE